MELNDAGGVGPETIYGTHEDSHLVMSEKVQSLAGSIYQEFEKMIARYDEDVVKTLMPLLVNVLECLDAAYQQNQEHDVELELLREDNEQLVTQYEREKSARKASEQKLLEFEDAAEGERKELTTRHESLESIVRMLELKHKNSLEHASRLEEREGESKKEFAKLHERYTELFKTHMDYMERTKILLSGQQLANEKADINRLNSNRLNIGRSSGPLSFGFTSLEIGEMVDSEPSSPISSTQSSPSLHSRSEPQNKQLIVPAEGVQNSETSPENKSAVASPTSPEAALPSNNNSRIHTKKEHRSGNTLYEELTFQDVDAEEDSDITGGWVHPGDYASSGMGKEVENLIMENNELLATKNALNVVKDDLIAKVDELTGELEMLREEILSLNLSRTKLKERISELEEELKKVKEAHEAKLEAGEDNSDVPMAQRKRFTRVEMARVLMERNQYKERFMELQDAVRWTEMIRASKSEAFDKKQSQGIWKFFNKLFNGSDRPSRPLAPSNMRAQPASNESSPSVRAFPRQDLVEAEMGSMSEKLSMRRAMEKREQYRYLKAHVRKDDGRLHAYGWSLPGKTTPVTKGSNGGVPVPVPVYCRPVAESSPGMNIWCATGVTSMDGYIRKPSEEEEGREDTDPAKEARDDYYEQFKRDEPKTPQSSQVWICSFTNTASIVTIIDANNPAEILDSFGVCTSRVLCIASIPAFNPTDVVSDSPLNCSNLSSPVKEEKELLNENEEAIPVIKTEGAKQIDKDAEIQEEEKYLGKLYFVKDEEAMDTTNRSDQPVPHEGESSNTKESTKESESDDVGTEEGKQGDDSGHETSADSEIVEDITSKMATMWIGTENGSLYVHSSVSNCSKCLHYVKLRDAIMSIVHIKGQVIVALACGMMAVFRRNLLNEWDLSQYYLVRLGLPQHAVRCLTVVEDSVWCGYRNKIHILQPTGLKVLHTIEAHPRRESPVRQMAWLGEGVWISIRLDSTLRLYHAHTYEHLQDVDIEPYVSKMLGTGKLGFTFVRITCLLVSSYRLWIGTANGVIISVPLSEKNSGKIIHSVNLPDVSSVSDSPPPPPLSTTGFIPYCSINHAQLSFHGHRANVKFFVAVPGNGGTSPSSKSCSPTNSPISSKHANTMLVMSGGEGYIDFRIADEETDDANKDSNEAKSQEDNASIISHLIVWQVSTAGV